MSFNSKLTELLKTDPRFVDDDGELILAAVQDQAWKIDHALVKLLLSDKDMKTKFFDEIEKHWVFNINTFLEFISQKNFLDNSYTRFRNRIGLTIDDKYLRERGEVSLVWAYKDTVLEGGQTKEEEKRKEIFFNEVLAQDEINRLLDPKVLTNFVRYTKNGKEKVKQLKRKMGGVLHENLIIKGNNLIALHTLKTQFRGQVKLIYIDPPYNTGNDGFGYNDSFNHSTWLTFVKNRLEIARELLKDDGIIFISCDDNEQAYLKIIMDEIFGRENFINNIIWHKKRGKDNSAKYFSITHEFLVVYGKHKSKVEILRTELTEETKKAYKNPDNDPRGLYRVLGIWSRQQGGSEYEYKTNKGKKYSKRLWLVNKETMKQYDDDNRLIESGDKLYYKLFLSENQGSIPETIWLDTSNNANAKDEIKKIFGEAVFGTPKPIPLIQKIVEITTLQNDIVLDFFSGSGTTAQAVIEVNKKDGGKRNFILVEQLDYVESITAERVKRVLEKSDDFIYCELMKYNEAFIERIQSAKNSKELLKIWGEMAQDSFLNWYVNPEMPEEAIKDFQALGNQEKGLEKQKKLLAELLDKNQLYVNLSEIDDVQFKVSKEDKALNKAFYGEGGASG